MGAPSLKVPKAMDGARGIPIWWGKPALGWKLELDGLYGPFQHKPFYDSMIL